MMSFYLPRPVLNAIADLEDIRHVDEFAHDPCGGVDDVVIRELGSSLLPAVRRPDEANLLFVDYVTTAIAAHVLVTYGVRRRKRCAEQSSLTAGQQARIKEIIAANLRGDVTIAQLAGECELSPSRFRSAFANSVGMTPQRWLLECRIEKAMMLIKRTSTPLSRVAEQCGFNDERHLARVFTDIVGVAPQQWRRTILL
jgi:AraC family transcriptional regulator